jgi:outer membrane protein OmpA-like peptidoglycan-associated protein
MRVVRCLLLAVLVGFVSVSQSMAGEQAMAPTVTGETGLFTLLSGDTLPQGGWSFGLYYNNWDRLFSLEEGIGSGDNDELSLDWNRLSASLGYGITDRWEISASVPYEDFNFDEDDIIGRPDIDASGLGNARLGTKFRLMGERGTEGAKLALNLFAELPTGDEDVASDDTGFGAGLGWSLSNWVFSVGYRDVGDDGLFNSELSAGLGYASAVSDRLDWITEVSGSFYDVDDDTGIELDDAVDFTTGGRLWLGEAQNWAFNFGLRTDLTQLSDIDEHCPIGGLIGLTMFPRLFQREEEVPPPPPPAPAPPPEAPAPAPAPTPPPPPPPPAPAPRPEERVTVNFPPGSARLSNIAKAKLDEVALRMKQDSEVRAQVLGYSDASGNADANQRMSEQRAQAVKNYLVTRHGIDPSRITTEGRGSAEATGNAEQDRRAVVILTWE